MCVGGDTLNPSVSNLPFEKIMLSVSLSFDDELSAALTRGVIVHVWNGPNPHVNGFVAILKYYVIRQ